MDHAYCMGGNDINVHPGHSLKIFFLTFVKDIGENRKILLKYMIVLELMKNACKFD